MGLLSVQMMAVDASESQYIMELGTQVVAANFLATFPSPINKGMRGI